MKFSLAIVTLVGCALTFPAIGSTSRPGRSVDPVEAKTVWGSACVFDDGIPYTGCGFPHLSFGQGVNSTGLFSCTGGARTATLPCGCGGTYSKLGGLCNPQG